MRKINKTQQPPELQHWKDENRNLPQNLTYGAANFPTSVVLQKLLTEQGYLCAYTMLRVSEQSAHIEHIKPQKECRITDDERKERDQPPLREDIAWNNLVACYPGKNSEEPSFGARVKKSTWENDKFISPLSDMCLTSFSFDRDGQISGKTEQAIWTIRTLNLDGDDLRERRTRAIIGWGIHRRSKTPKSATAARRLIEQIKASDSSCLYEFCQAIIHAAEDYIRWREQLSTQQREARKSQRR